jgi:hypothetical protein
LATVHHLIHQQNAIGWHHAVDNNAGGDTNPTTLNGKQQKLFGANLFATRRLPYIAVQASNE